MTNEGPVVNVLPDISSTMTRDRFTGGGLLVASRMMISSNGDLQFGGNSLAAGDSALMTLGMGHRLLKTGKFMPAGVVSVLSAASMGYHTMKALEWK